MGRPGKLKNSGWGGGFQLGLGGTLEQVGMLNKQRLLTSLSEETLGTGKTVALGSSPLIGQLKFLLV